LGLVRFIGRQFIGRQFIDTQFIDSRFIDSHFIDKTVLSTPGLSTRRLIDTTLDRQINFIDMTVLSKLLFLSLFTYRNTCPVGATQT
jgi:hypothetical protein